MEITDTHEKLKSLSNFLSEYVSTLLAVGVHSSRIERNTTRIVDSFGFNVQLTILQKSIIMTIRSADDEHMYSTVTAVKHRPISFELNSDLSALSWQAYDEHLSVDELRTRFDRMISKPTLNRYVVLLLVSCANASFCRLFGGDWEACVVVFFGTALGVFVRQWLTVRSVIHYFVFFLSALVASLSVGIIFPLGISSTPEVAIATSVLFLVPGVPLINGVVDIVEGHVLSGAVRLINAFLLIFCLAAGLLCSIMIMGGGIL